MPTAAEIERTIDRLLAFPEAHVREPCGRRASCECNRCPRCLSRIRGRLRRRGITLGWWHSARARAALGDRLSGLGWQEIAKRNGYADQSTARSSVMALVDLTQQEKVQLARVKPARRRARIEIVAGPATVAVRRMTRAEQLAQWRAEVAEEALHAVRADASRSEIRGFLSLLDQIDAKIATLREADTATSTEQRRAAIAADRAVAHTNGANGSRGTRRWVAGTLPSKAATPLNAAQRKGLNQLSIRRAPATGG